MAEDQALKLPAWLEDLKSDFWPPITKLLEHFLVCTTLCSLADQEVLIISREKPLS
jgi:hypothetical protein